MKDLLCNQTLNQFTVGKLDRGHNVQYNYTYEVDRMLHASIPIGVATRYPMQKILREVAKLLLLNNFEAALLHWMLKDNGQLMKGQPALHPVLKELIRYDEHTFRSEEYSRLFANVLCNAYYVKVSVNGIDRLKHINADIYEMSPSFTTCYERWSRPQSLKTLTLSVINQIFVSNSRTRLDQQPQLNYNGLVDDILNMSKPYNTAEKEEEQQEESQHQEPSEQPIVQPQPKKKGKAVTDKKKVPFLTQTQKKGQKQKPVEEKPPKSTLMTRSTRRLPEIAGAEIEQKKAPHVNESRIASQESQLSQHTPKDLRRSTRNNLISSQEDDLDFLNRPAHHDGFGLMNESRRSIGDFPAQIDMLRSLDHNWGQLRFDSRRTINANEGLNLSMRQTRNAQHNLPPPTPQVIMRRVDSEEEV